MQPYDEHATCPKCGGADVLTVYVAGHRAWDTPRCGLMSPEKRGEHLDRICQRCHAEWPEAVLNAPATPGSGIEGE